MSDEMAYVGIAPCGCVRAACVDVPDQRKYTAKFCGEMIRDGLRLDRMTVVAVRVARWECATCEKPATAPTAVQSEMAL